LEGGINGLVVPVFFVVVLVLVLIGTVAYFPRPHHSRPHTGIYGPP